MQKKTLRSLLEQCALDWRNQNVNFWTQPKKVSFGEKKGEAFVENNTLPTVKHEGGYIILWGCVAACHNARKPKIISELEVFCQEE